MSFLSKLTSPARTGEKNFERARSAEGRREFDTAADLFQAAADAFDEHMAKQAEAGKEIRTPHLVMAGICYTKIGRNKDALALFRQCIERKEVPDAFLHAGYAAAKLGHAEDAATYWAAYPDWADQRIIAAALKEQVTAIRKQGESALQTACEAVAEAVFRQDKQNRSAKLMARGARTLPKQEY